MKPWVKFHTALCRGAKRGIPRALRFVYMELSLEAYELRGEIPLPVGMELVDAVHDLIGGNRREIERALEVFLAKPEDPTDEPPLKVVTGSGCRTLVVSKWETWNARDSSTPRVRKHRENASLGDHETRSVTVSETRIPVSVTPIEKSREEKRREEPPNPLVVQPRKEAHPEEPPASLTRPDAESGVMLVLTPPEPAKPTREEIATKVLEHWAAQGYHGRRPKLTSERRKRVMARLAEGFTQEDLELAIEGAELDDWLMGRHPKSSPGGYRDIETLLREASQVEKLRPLGEKLRQQRAAKAAAAEEDDIDRWLRVMPRGTPDPRKTGFAPPEEVAKYLKRIAEISAERKARHIAWGWATA